MNVLVLVVIDNGFETIINRNQNHGRYHGFVVIDKGFETFINRNQKHERSYFGCGWKSEDGHRK